MASFYADKTSAVDNSADLTAVEMVPYLPHIHTYTVPIDIIQSDLGPNEVTGYNTIEEVDTAYFKCMYVCMYV